MTQHYCDKKDYLKRGANCLIHFFFISFFSQSKDGFICRTLLLSFVRESVDSKIE